MMGNKIEDWISDIFQLISDTNAAHDAAIVFGADAARLNEKIYGGITGDRYRFSFMNPDYADYTMGNGMGKLFSFLSAESYSIIGYKFDKKIKLWENYVRLAEDIKFLYEYGKLTYESFYNRIYQYLYDSCDDVYEERIKDMLKPHESAAMKIIMKANLANAYYLYGFGECITENELKTARYLNTLSEDDIKKMARVFTEGYKRGFEITGRPFEKKKSVGLIYKLGFERLVREEILQFREMGLETTLFRAPVNALLRKGTSRNGYFGAVPNEQAYYDHRNDLSFFADESLMAKRLESLENAYKKYSIEADVYGGPAVMETFGELPFDYKETETGMEPSEKQKTLSIEFARDASAIANKYIKGEERSFTIIAYPTPEIGDRFKEIFAETVKLNTLDNDEYLNIQQYLIDTLNTAEYVHIRGANGNDTDLKVCLMKAEDPEKQEIFENCVADVNIPVGEVFTSPRLEGTCGRLYVKKVFLAGYEYKDLNIVIKDGFVVDYSCSNYEDPSKGKAYFRKNVLHDHESLPMGEFAIGTNTTAYAMSRKYDIGNLMPILIAEKCGPHFALGDTCYSYGEDVVVYNPNGKEIIAKDNSVSARRKTDPAQAYFNCHTDIMIPYEEIGHIKAAGYDGNETMIIENGRFVLPGTESLNEALEGFT